MKFEKFFKATGTHGTIVKFSESESWLICGGVGMKIPDGVNNLGVSVEPTEFLKSIVNSVPEDDYLHLVEAVLPNPQGKTNDIVRIFETDFGDRVGIMNKDYGLLENSDLLTYLEIESGITHKFMVVRDHNGEAIGFIDGQ